MAIFRLTDDNFDDVINKTQFVIVDFWAAWCSTCSSFAPIYIQLSENHPDILFAKVNTQYEQTVSARYRIQSIPTLIAFRDGKDIYRKPGAISAQVLDEIVAKLRNYQES